MAAQEQNLGRGASTLEGDSWTRWVQAIRTIEFDKMLEHVPLTYKSAVLEVGSGDGFQLGLIRKRFATVFAIDPEKASRGARTVSFAVAEALPFRDSTFDLLLSSCVLEHLQDRSRGLQEMVRVLRPGGYMAHAVPACYWKATSCVLNPLGYPLRLLEKWRALRRTRDAQRGLGSLSGQARPVATVSRVLGRWLSPPIHGSYSSHLEEYRAYRRSEWKRFFAHPDLDPVAEIPLFSYSQFGLLRWRLLSWRKWMARHGLESSRAFIFRKKAR